MSRYRSDTELSEYEEPSACANFLHYSWKTVTCIFSHVALVSMVVSYCALGAFTFEALEYENEIKVKKGIKNIRDNITEHLWNFTQKQDALVEENFTIGAELYLQSFEKALLDAMNKDGWDGIEDVKKLQWTTTGALFYSIIVITTIGYGHIAPKTPWGKVVTIFYAILGIPLMLLCLSNIGDIMATSFRFLYWRVCCYVCEKKPKKLNRGRSMRASTSASRFTRSRNASFRRSVRTSTRSADSGFAAFSDCGPAYHSDSDLRTTTERARRCSSIPRQKPNRFNRSSDAPNKSPSNFDSLPLRKFSQNATLPRSNYTQPQRGFSLDRRREPKEAVEIEMDPMLLVNTPILCNKYVVGKNDGFTGKIPGLTPRQLEAKARATSMPPIRNARNSQKTKNYLEPPRLSSPEHSDEEDAEYPTSRRPMSRRKSPMRRSKSPNPSIGPSPRMMTPLGYGYKSKYLDDPDSDEEYFDEDYFYETGRVRVKPVPIWLCVLLVVSYILAGAYLFKTWESWDYLDSAYFCFITLTTIGFGDLVPAKGVSQNGYYATVSIGLCSLYLLFGISLLAMSFNLVQEEVIANVKSVAKIFGIIKSDSDNEDEDV